VTKTALQMADQIESTRSRVFDHEVAAMLRKLNHVAEMAQKLLDEGVQTDVNEARVSMDRIEDLHRALIAPR